MSAVGEDTTQLWMVPYADLMSILVLFFMALFGYAMLGKTANYEAALERIEHELSGEQIAALEEIARKNETELAQWLEARVQEGLPEGRYGMDYAAHEMRLRMESPVLFASGSADLHPDAVRFLEELAAKLAPLPNEVRVEGHTDALPVVSGRYPTNWELSAARAFAVLDVLRRGGVAPDRLAAWGHGPHRPIAPNDDPEGRARNRRIEITLVRR